MSLQRGILYSSEPDSYDGLNMDVNTHVTYRHIYIYIYMYRDDTIVYHITLHCILGFTVHIYIYIYTYTYTYMRTGARNPFRDPLVPKALP